MSEKQPQWAVNLAKIRDSLHTLAFLTEDELSSWLDHPDDYASLQDWAEGMGDVAHGLFVPIRTIEAQQATANESRERAQIYEEHHNNLATDYFKNWQEALTQLHDAAVARDAAQAVARTGIKVNEDNRARIAALEGALREADSWFDLGSKGQPLKRLVGFKAGAEWRTRARALLSPTPAGAAEASS